MSQLLRLSQSQPSSHAFLEERSGFGWLAMARYQRMGTSRLGVLFIEDSDVCDSLDPLRNPLSIQNGAIKVLVRAPTGQWRCESVTSFSPGGNKLHLLLRTGSSSWQPFPLVVEKLAAAHARGEDVLRMPVQRCTVELEFRTVTKHSRVREMPTGVVIGEPRWEGQNTDYRLVGEFLERFPAAVALDPCPVPAVAT